MRSLLVEGLPETEPKENKNISRQQLAAGNEWRPLKKFPSHCTAITIILGLRSCGSCHQPEPGPVAMDNSVIRVIRLRILSSLFRQMSEFSLFAGNWCGDDDTGKG